MTAPRRALSPSRTAIVGLTALAIAMGVGRFAFTPILPMMQAEARVPIVDGASLASAFAIGQIGGPLVVRFVVRGDDSFAAALVIAGAVLVGTSALLAVPARRGA